MKKSDYFICLAAHDDDEWMRSLWCKTRKVKQLRSVGYIHNSYTFIYKVIFNYYCDDKIPSLISMQLSV